MLKKNNEKDLKIIIEKDKNGITVSITGKSIDQKEVASILLKTFMNTCKALNIDISDFLDEMIKDS